MGRARDRRELVRRMTNALAHRGPDGEGFYDDELCSLGHRRLSIIDLSDRGKQPMANEDGTVQLSYNGEIYNFPELRTDLVGRGHTFRSQTDSEVIVHLYEEYGWRLVEHLNGMFAFALWDRAKATLLLARDRWGQKPLYFANLDNTLLFASEIKALRECPGLPTDIDPRAVDSFMTSLFVPSPLSFYRAIQRVEPGTVLVAEPGKDPIKLHSARRTIVRTPRRMEEAVEETSHLLRSSVRRQLVADVPVGVFLSGGIDSSLILDAVSRAGTGGVRAFTIAFPGSPNSELPHAQQLARKLGIGLVPIEVSADHFADPTAILSMFDEPFADVAAIPAAEIARLARPHITVALTGDGGDELFGGYYHHIAAPWLSRIAALPGHTALAGLARSALSLGPGRGERRQKIDRALAMTAAESWSRALVAMRTALDREQRKALYTADFEHALATFDPYAALLPRSLAPDEGVNTAFDVARDQVLADLFLQKADITSMRVGMEVRSPFLDVPLADFASSLPLHLLTRRGQGKVVLRELLHRVEPTLAARRKQGLSPPIETWLRGPLRGLVQDVLLGPGALVTSYLEAKRLQTLVGEHERGDRNHKRVLWAALQLELWLRRGRAATHPTLPSKADEPTSEPSSVGTS